jgi:hypothetical protein
LARACASASSKVSGPARTGAANNTDAARAARKMDGFMLGSPDRGRLSGRLAGGDAPRWPVVITFGRSRFPRGPHHRAVARRHGFRVWVGADPDTMRRGQGSAGPCLRAGAPFEMTLRGSRGLRRRCKSRRGNEKCGDAKCGRNETIRHNDILDLSLVIDRALTLSGESTDSCCQIRRLGGSGSGP